MCVCGHPVCTNRIRIRRNFWATSEERSGVIGGCPKICIENGLATWRSEGASLRLQGHEDGVDLLQSLWIFELHDPTMLTLIIGIENSQPQWLLFTQLVAVAAPGCEDKFAIRDLVRGQIVCIEDERLALSIEGSSKGFPDATCAVDIHDIHDVNVASRHDVANLPVSLEHLSLSIYATLQIRKLCFPIRSFDLQAGDCCLVGLNCCLSLSKIVLCFC